MYMEHISAGKNSLPVRLQALVDLWPLGNRIHLHAKPLGQLVLGNQSAGEEQSVTFDFLLCSVNRFGMFIHLSNHYSLHSLFSFDIHHSMAQLQRNSKIIQTLNNISFQSAGVWHQFCNKLHLRTLQSHAAGHNQPDVAGAEDYHLPAGHSSFHIDVTLCRAGRIDSCGTVTRNIQSPSGTFSTAHGKNHRSCLYGIETFFTIHNSNQLPVLFYSLLLRQIYHHSIEFVGNFQR